MEESPGNRAGLRGDSLDSFYLQGLIETNNLYTNACKMQQMIFSLWDIQPLVSGWLWKGVILISDWSHSCFINFWAWMAIFVRTFNSNQVFWRWSRKTSKMLQPDRELFDEVVEKEKWWISSTPHIWFQNQITWDECFYEWPPWEAVYLVLLHFVSYST